MNIRVYVTPKQGILDPQGAAVERSLPDLGYDGVSGVRIGKIINLTLSSDLSADDARAKVDDMCRRLYQPDHRGLHLEIGEG